MSGLNIHGLPEVAPNLGPLWPLPAESSAPKTCNPFTKSAHLNVFPLASPRISELVRGWAGGAQVVLSGSMSLGQAWTSAAHPCARAPEPSAQRV